MICSLVISVDKLQQIVLIQFVFMYQSTLLLLIFSCVALLYCNNSIHHFRSGSQFQQV